IESSDAELEALKFSYYCFNRAFCVFFVASFPPNRALIAANINWASTYWSKENPNVSSFKMKQPSKELQEAWEQLFGGLLVGGSVVVGLDMDQDTSSEIPNVNLENAEIPNVNLDNAEIPNVNHENVEIPNVNLKNVAINIDDDTEPIPVWNHYSQHLDAKENDFYSSLMRDVGLDIIP
ncbi:hypothetical protein Tco_0933316, partial [Tanacetum coccineum]